MLNRTLNNRYYLYLYSLLYISLIYLFILVLRDFYCFLIGNTTK